MPFPSSFFDYLATHTLIEIKGGVERKSFLSIWMVNVGQRVFARSWNKSAKSWFTAFQETGLGQVKYGDQVLDIRGEKLGSDSSLHPLINQAYLEKYTQERNLFYAQGITQPEYAEFTLEFFYD